MAIKYVCDRCGGEVKDHGELAKIQQVNYPDGSVKRDLSGPDLCKSCIDDVLAYAEKKKAK